jgi:hypothetical protein
MTSHTVIVFAETIEEAKNLLAPFDENIKTEPHSAGPVTEDKIQQFRDWCQEQGYNIGRDISRIYALKGKEWNNNLWLFDKKSGQWIEWTTDNPDGHWDWYHQAYPQQVAISWRNWQTHHPSPPTAFVSPDGKWVQSQTYNPKDDPDYLDKYNNIPVPYKAHIFIFTFHK